MIWKTKLSCEEVGLRFIVNSYDNIKEMKEELFYAALHSNLSSEVVKEYIKYVREASENNSKINKIQEEA